MCSQLVCEICFWDAYHFGYITKFMKKKNSYRWRKYFATKKKTHCFDEVQMVIVHMKI
jgi:hypothetical protein